jgi:NAD dependent epimerase/dehydratase family enzyme
LVALMTHAIRTSVSGAVNGTAPNPVTNTAFTRELAAALGRPALFPAPAFALKLMLGEMSEILLGSQRVLPKAAEAAGFRFAFPELAPALRSIL